MRKIPKRGLSLFFALFLSAGVLFSFASGEGSEGRPVPPSVSAHSAILVDVESGRVLFQKNADESRPIASITKLMTALVAVESKSNLQELVEVKHEHTLAEGSSMYLKAGERVSFEALLYGLLLESGNDAALVVAEFCAGDQETFVEWMNLRAASLGMQGTSFRNPNGLNADGHNSSASDMAKLAAQVLAEPTLAKIVSSKYANFGERSFKNHNKLLWQYEGAIGMKTGYTKLAGRTLVSAAERDGQKLVVVTLNAPDDWNDHARLLDYGFRHYPRFTLSRAGKVFCKVPVRGSLVPMVDLCMGSSIGYPAALGETIRGVMERKELYEAPIKQGAIAGSLSYYLNDELIGKTYLLFGQAVPDNRPGEKGVFQWMRELLRREKRDAILKTMYAGAGKTR